MFRGVSGARTDVCPELSPYLPLIHSAVSCLYTVVTDWRYQMRNLKVISAANSEQ